MIDLLLSALLWWLPAAALRMRMEATIAGHLKANQSSSPTDRVEWWVSEALACSSDDLLWAGGKKKGDPSYLYLYSPLSVNSCF